MNESIEQVLTDRAKTHGDFAEGAEFCQDVMRSAEKRPGWSIMSDVQKEGFHHIIQKLQRAVCGDPNFEEHWLDVMGYVERIIEDMRRKAKK